jgi:transposase
MDKFVNALGIDVSKKTLDVYDYAGQLACQFSNCKEGFKQFLKWAKRNNGNLPQVLVCFEHTGMYSLPLAVYLTEQKWAFAMLPGLEIKRSLGIQRGKSDKADAKAIAKYAYLHRDEVRIYKLPSDRILELKSLLSLREKMVGQRAGYQATRREAKAFGSTNSKLIVEIQNKLIKELNAHIKSVEQQIKQVIASDAVLKKIYDLVTSVKGVGLILGTTMMVYTNCFSTFDDWRKFACYCGIVPFPFQSGTSIRGKQKIHHLANKRLKALLSNAACTSIQFNPEMKAYYQRRIQEGKSKMSTQNIIRNKIVARVFAAVQRGTPYVDTLKYAA